MSHSLTKIWIHGIFGTKDRGNLITPTFEEHLYTYLKTQLEEELNCKVRIINGIADHIHLLFLLGPNFAIKDIFKQTKGSSSYWINHNNFSEVKFSWQTGYGAFSVSESKLKDVENNIKNQKEHHQKMSFTEEYNRLLGKHNLVG